MSHLFDKQGGGDDDLRALEERLSAARYQPKQRSFADQVKPRRRRGPVGLVAAAAVLLAAAWAFVPHGPSLSVTTASGAVSQLHVGRWLETREPSTIALTGIGQVTVEPRSRVRIIETSKSKQRLELAEGALHAVVNAPPRLFVVDTPAVQAVDLGCEYRLVVEPSGLTRLEVLTGEVSLEGEGVASRVPAGAVCRTAKGKAPGVPRAATASAEVTAALDAYEAGGPLEPVLAAAQGDDAVSLWNLVSRVPTAQRPAVLGRLYALIEKPAINDADAVALEPKAMESLWQAVP